jgi:hypothetical protein
MKTEYIDRAMQLITAAFEYNANNETTKVMITSKWDIAGNPSLRVSMFTVDREHNSHPLHCLGSYFDAYESAEVNEILQIEKPLPLNKNNGHISKNHNDHGKGNKPGAMVKNK